MLEEPLQTATHLSLQEVRRSEAPEIARIVQLPPTETSPARDLELRIRRLEPDEDEQSTRLLLLIAERSALKPNVEPIEAVAQTGAEAHRRINELERALALSEENLQTTIEELETSNEELQATNEELQATNEEMMASNEELQTVNEELHAVNEELYTVSGEHNIKIRELVGLSDDLNNLLRSIRIGVIFLDADHCIRRVTPDVTKTFNILERDIGRPVEHLTSRFPFDDLEHVIDRVMETNEPEERSISADGSDYILRVLPYRRGETTIGTVLTFVDISEIARANRSLLQFADIVSHDLKAPLRTVRASTDMLIEDLGDDVSEEIKAHAARITSGADRLSSMLADLREYSTLGRVRQEAELVSIADMLADIEAMFGQDQLTLVRRGAMPEIVAPKAALRLVFQNIIDNAVKHCHRAPTTVTVSATRHGREWVFRFEDDGPGIEPRHHDRVFQPFRRLKRNSDASGTGIGLALVKKTLDEHHGSIRIASEPETKPGATFIVTWPVRE